MRKKKTKMPGEECYTNDASGSLNSAIDRARVALRKLRDLEKARNSLIRLVEGIEAMADSGDLWSDESDEVYTNLRSAVIKATEVFENCIKKLSEPS